MATPDTRRSEIANPEPVEAPLGDASPGFSGARRKTRFWSAGLLLALVSSIAVHASAIALLGDRIPRPGVEAPTETASIEIVFDAPRSQPVAGDESAQRRQEPAASTNAAEASVSDDTEPQADDTEPQTSETEEAAGAPDQPVPEAPPETPEPTPVDTTEPEVESDEAPDSLATVVLPQEGVPVPTARPQPPRATEQAKARPPEAQRERPETPPAPRRQAAQAPTTAPTAEPARRSSAASAASRQGGATAGEKAAYSRKLLSHVERHKRYPREAARQGIAGTAGLSITIDRQGRLASARLSRRSGHSILDEEALAVARRAAPYPRPPNGIGGSTITFSVALRFSR